MNNQITEHKPYLIVEQRRKGTWQRRRWQHQRDGRTPPLIWADDPETAEEKRGIKALMSKLRECVR